MITISTINNGFETIPSPNTAATNTAARWIDGTAAGNTSMIGTLRWAIPSGGIVGTSSAQFDTTQSHSGAASLRLTNPTTASTIIVSTFRNNPPSATQLNTGEEGIPILPSTRYRVGGWIKTNNVASNAAFLDFRQFSTTTSLVTTSSTKLTGTNGWTNVTFEVTTDALAAFGAIILRNNVTGNVSDTWFDDITIAEIRTKSHTTSASLRVFDARVRATGNSTTVKPGIRSIGG